MSEPNSKMPNLSSKTREFIKSLEQTTPTPLYTLTPEEARNFLVELQKKSYKEIQAEIEDTSFMTPIAGNVDVRIIRPKRSSEKLPVIVYIHGGGWIMGDEFTHDTLVRKLAIHTNSAVFFVKYTPSPDAQYPVSLNQCYAVIDYIYNNPDGLNIDSERIAVAGDSAGANMATVAALMAKKENGPKIIFQALFYPVTDASMQSGSYKNFKDGPWLTKKAMEWFFNAYIPDEKLRQNALISPINATIEELKGMPPALIITDENDVLRDEGEAYARKLDLAGVDVLNVRVNGTCHDFMMLNALADTKPAEGAMVLANNILKKVLHKENQHKN